MANHSNTQTTTTATTGDGDLRYMAWTGTTQAAANQQIGEPYFSTDNLINLRAVMDKLASYRGSCFISVLDLNTLSVFSGQDF